MSDQWGFKEYLYSLTKEEEEQLLQLAKDLDLEWGGLPIGQSQVSHTFGEKVVSNGPKLCICSTYDLLAVGCKCGSFKREKGTV